MSLFFRKTEMRAGPSFQQVFATGGNTSVFENNAATALTLIPVYAATSLIADQGCAAPWAEYQDEGGVSKKVRNQSKLLTKPSPLGLDLYSWKHQMFASLLLWGNAYGKIHQIDGGGVPSAVTWLRPDQMRIDEDGPTPRFWFNDIEIPRDEIIHIPLYVLPGSIKGLSPIGLFRTQIETGLQSQTVARNFYKRGAVPSAVLKNTARTMTAEQADIAKRKFMSSVSSSEPFVTGSDWDYKSLGLPQSDVNFLQGIKATATQVAAIYRVPPEDIGGETGGGSLTYKNLEQDMIRFNTRTMRPIVMRVEAVFDPLLRTGNYLRFNLDAGARADLKTRYEAHQIALETEFMTDDEVRELEEKPPFTAAQRLQMRERQLPVSTNSTGGAK